MISGGFWEETSVKMTVQEETLGMIYHSNNFLDCRVRGLGFKKIQKWPWVIFIAKNAGQSLWTSSCSSNSVVFPYSVTKFAFGYKFREFVIVSVTYWYDFPWRRVMMLLFLRWRTLKPFLRNWDRKRYIRAKELRLDRRTARSLHQISDFAPNITYFAPCRKLR